MHASKHVQFPSAGAERGLGLKMVREYELNEAKKCLNEKKGTKIKIVDKLIPNG